MAYVPDHVPVQWDLLDPTQRCVDLRLFHRGFMPRVNEKGTVEFPSRDSVGLSGLDAQLMVGHMFSCDGYGWVVPDTGDTFADIAEALGLPGHSFEALFIEPRKVTSPYYTGLVTPVPEASIIDAFTRNTYAVSRDSRIVPRLDGKQAFRDVTSIIGKVHLPDDKVPEEGGYCVFLFDVWDYDSNTSAGYLLETCRVSR